MGSYILLCLASCIETHLQNRVSGNLFLSCMRGASVTPRNFLPAGPLCNSPGIRKGLPVLTVNRSSLATVTGFSRVFMQRHRNNG